MGQHQREYQDLFNTSNAQTEEHKNFILENDQERLANIQWAKEAHAKYDELLRDFLEYKENTNALYGKLSQQYKDEVIRLTARVDESMIAQRTNRDRMDILTERGDEFEKKRVELTADVVQLKRDVVMLTDKKLDERKAVDSFQKVHNKIFTCENVAQKIRDDLSTLENFAERYLPLNTLKIVNQLILPLFEESQLKKFEKVSYNLVMEMQNQILNDIG